MRIGVEASKTLQPWGVVCTLRRYPVVAKFQSVKSRTGTRSARMLGRLYPIANRGARRKSSEARPSLFLRGLDHRHPRRPDAMDLERRALGADPRKMHGVRRQQIERAHAEHSPLGLVELGAL